jgi:hypothetical protein
VPDSIQSAPPATPKRLPIGIEKRLVQQVILEILTQAGTKQVPGLGREFLALTFWLAHLYYAKSHPGYLTTWPLVRTSWGVEIRGASALLRELVEEEFVRVEQRECGPFPVTVYLSTGKKQESELPPAAVEAIRRAASENHVCPTFFPAWPVPLSRAWRATPDGEEMDIYLDLIPEDEYEERRRQLESLKDDLGDLFS